MKQSGRIHWMVAVGVVGIAIIVSLMLFAKEGPEQSAAKFMSALCKSDVKTLTELSYFPSASKEELEKQWEFSSKVAGKYYTMTWHIKFSKETDSGLAGVAMEVTRDSFNPMSYPENYQLPMILKDGKWLVDISSISRTLFPALPR